MRATGVYGNMFPCFARPLVTVLKSFFSFPDYPVKFSNSTFLLSWIIFSNLRKSWTSRMVTEST